MAARDASAQCAEIAVSIDAALLVRVVVVMRVTVCCVGMLLLMLVRVLRVLLVMLLLLCVERCHARLVLCHVERAVHVETRRGICGMWLVIIHTTPTTAHKWRDVVCRHLLHR